MAYQFPTEIQQIVDQQMASGKYASEDELLLSALGALNEYQDAVVDIQQARRADRQ